MSFADVYSKTATSKFEKITSLMEICIGNTFYDLRSASADTPRLKKKVFTSIC